MYISFVFLGFYRSKTSLAVVPFLVILSGSKLVAISTAIFFVITFIFGRMSFKGAFLLTISALISFVLHRWMFGSLFDFQFNVDILLYSINTRLVQYEITSLENVIQYLSYTGAIIFAVYVLIKLLGLNRFKVIMFHFLIVIVALVASFIATPHIGNMLFGWFYLPSLFWFSQTKKIS